MLFKINDISFYKKESYKERNLYYKIFAGYLLNELVVGYEQRKLDFFNLIQNRLNDANFSQGNKESIIQILESKEINLELVTFDYHTSQTIDKIKDADRGEASDILLWFQDFFISIECKYLSNATIEKDINEVQNRIMKMKNYFGMEALQIVLLKEKKWKHSKRTNRDESFASKFIERKNSMSIPCIILFWEEMENLINDSRVKNYLKQQLERKSN